MTGDERQLDHFVLIERIGAGGMGEVFRAEDTQLSREVAIKVLPPDFTDDEERRERFLREARAAAGLRHNNVVVVHAVGESDGTAYIAMELVAGRTVADVLADSGPMDADEARRVAIAVGSALAAAHNKSIVHRDIKPANVMVGNDGTVKVLDFGLAAWRASEEQPAAGDTSEEDATATAATPRTEEGRVLGTPGYMSPEQALGRRTGIETDVFALAVMLYEMLHDARPFGGDTAGERMVSTARDDPRPIDDDVPADLAALIRDCLVKEPDERPSARMCVDRLTKRTDPGGDSSVERAAVDRSVSASTTSADKKGAGWPMVGGVAAVVALAIAAWTALREPAVPTTGSSSATSASAAASAGGAMRIVDLPIYGDPKPDAEAAYKKGIQARRDAAWPVARSHFDEAVVLDPGFAQAWLRKARSDIYLPDQRLATGRKLATMREELRGRDRELFEALKPMILEAKVDGNAYRNKICALADRHPRDAELQLECAAALRGDGAKVEPYAKRAVGLDPAYADAWQLLGEAQLFLDRLDDAEASFGRCVAVSPIATDCRNVRAKLFSFHGDCAEARREGLEIIAMTPDGLGNTTIHAEAMAALNEPYAKVAGVLKKSFDMERDATAEFPLARLEAWLGRFQEAETRIRAVLANNEASYPLRARATVFLSELLIETRQDEEVVGVVRSAIEARPVDGGEARTAAADPLPRLWALQLRAGEAHSKAALAALNHWDERWADAQNSSWIHGPARLVEDAASAKAALKEHDASKLVRRLRYFVDADAYSAYARVHRLAGDAPRALELYQQAARLCTTFGAPFAHVRASFWIGRLQEDRGNKAEACAAYQRVLDRWGKAKPKSMTATGAKERRDALGCD